MTIARRRTRLLVHGFLLALLAAYSLFPIYMVAIESLKSEQEDVFGSPFVLRHVEFRWYDDLFEPARWMRGTAQVEVTPFVVWVENTAMVFGGSLAVILGASLAGGYAIGRLRPPGWRWWRRALFASYLVPQTLLFLPLYALAFRIHLDDRLAALVLIYPALAIPFGVWLLSAYFQRLSPDIEDSARVEGATRLGAFVRIILPMSWPVLATLGIFALGAVSSDFVFASVLLPNQFHQTLAVGLGTMDVGLEDLSVVAGVNLAALMVVPVCAAFAGPYVRGLTAAMLEGA